MLAAVTLLSDIAPYRKRLAPQKGVLKKGYSSWSVCRLPMGGHRRYLLPETSVLSDRASSSQRSTSTRWRTSSVWRGIALLRAFACDYGHDFTMARYDHPGISSSTTSRTSSLSLLSALCLRPGAAS